MADRNGEAYAACQCRGIDAGHPAVAGDKRAAREARIHDDVSLQVAVHLAARRCTERAAQGGHEAEHSLHAAPGPAKRQGQVANPQFAGVAPCGSAQLPAPNPQHGQIGAGIAAYQLRRHALAVGQPDREIVVALDHMMGRHDHAVGAVDDTGGGHAVAALHAHDCAAGPLHQVGDGVG